MPDIQDGDGCVEEHRGCRGDVCKGRAVNELDEAAPLAGDKELPAAQQMRDLRQDGAVVADLQVC